MKNIKIIEEVLKLYNIAYLLCNDEDGEYILIADNLTDIVFETLNIRAKELEFNYVIKPHHINSIIIKII